MFSEEDEEGEEEEERYSFYDDDGTSHHRENHLVADIVGGGQGLMFVHQPRHHYHHQSLSEDQFISPRESLPEDNDDNIQDTSEFEGNHYASDQTQSVHRSPLVSDFEAEEVVEEHHDEQEQEHDEQEVVTTDDSGGGSVLNSVPIESDMVESDKTCDGTEILLLVSLFT